MTDAYIGALAEMGVSLTELAVKGTAVDCQVKLTHFYV